MINGLVSTTNISFILVFFEGLLSFFSPCVIPLIPLYMGYLAGNTEAVGEDGIINYNRKKVFLHTLSFVLGISLAFFILGITFTAMGTFLNQNQMLFTRIAGILIIVMGLFQLDFFNFNFLHRERKFNFSVAKRTVNPIVAFVLGFTFSFAWTPCVGPALSSVLILASSAKSSFAGNALVVVYALGFVIPFLLLGIFTTQALNLLKKYKKLLKYTVKAGGVILIIMGVMTYTGWMNSVSGYLNTFGSASVSEPDEQLDDSKNNPEASESTNNESPAQDTTDAKVIPAFDFELVDQYGNTHIFSDYKGKVVFLNFWATWCPPCNLEMPDIEALYKEHNFNQDDVVILGVASPKSPENMNTREVDKEGVLEFLAQKEYTFPVLFDNTADISRQYSITALPTTFMIDKEGNIYGYVPGMLTKDMMRSIINQTLNATE